MRFYILGITKKFYRGSGSKMKLNQFCILKVLTIALSEELKTKREGEKHNINCSEWIFFPTTKSTYKSKAEELEDATYNCG